MRVKILRHDAAGQLPLWFHAMRCTHDTPQGATLSNIVHGFTTVFINSMLLALIDIINLFRVMRYGGGFEGSLPLNFRLYYI